MSEFLEALVWATAIVLLPIAFITWIAGLCWVADNMSPWPGAPLLLAGMIVPFAVGFWAVGDGD